MIAVARPLALFCVALSLCISGSAEGAELFGYTPRDVSANQTEQGLRIASKGRGNEFSLMLEGRDFKPLSSERLQVASDGRDVEIVFIPVASDLAEKPDVETLEAYKRWAVSKGGGDGWHLVENSEEAFAFSNGKKCLLWEMESPGKGSPQAQYRIIAATTNYRNVVALIGSGADADALASMKAYLRVTLLTLRSEKPEQTPAPTAEELLDAGAPLAQSLELWRLLTGIESRALLNNRLMTEQDNSLPAAIPVEPDTLMRATRHVLRNAHEKEPMLPAFVFDGKSLHAINLTGYDDQTDRYAYWDPWGKGSFLAAGSNVARVAATPDAKKPRIWNVRSEELRRVIYALELEFGAMSKLAGEIPLGAFAALGDRIDDAKKTDLFTWFHLKQTATGKNAAGHRVATFRSTSGQFGPLAALDVTTDEGGRLLDLDLRLHRSFIDDPATTAFARDFAKSFLRSATAERDEPWIGPLLKQIEFDIKGLVLFGKSPPDASLPSQPTEDYLTFLGQKERMTRALSLTNFSMTNLAAKKDSELVISLETMR